jgi:hypothetical protein
VISVTDDVNNINNTRHIFLLILLDLDFPITAVIAGYTTMHCTGHLAEATTNENKSS